MAPHIPPHTPPHLCRTLTLFNCLDTYFKEPTSYLGKPFRNYLEDFLTVFYKGDPNSLQDVLNELKAYTPGTELKKTTQLVEPLLQEWKDILIEKGNHNVNGLYRINGEWEPSFLIFLMSLPYLETYPISGIDDTTTIMGTAPEIQFEKDIKTFLGNTVGDTNQPIPFKYKVGRREDQ